MVGEFVDATPQQCLELGIGSGQIDGLARVHRRYLT
jgi:hypothetical protein